jgi:hypothetical protein
LVEALSGTVAVVVLVVDLPVAVAVVTLPELVAVVVCVVDLPVAIVVVALPELDVEQVEYRVAVQATMVYS